MRTGKATFSSTTGFAAGVSSCCTSCGTYFSHKERHKDNSGHWHDAEVKVHGDKLVITYEDEDA